MKEMSFQQQSEAGEKAAPHTLHIGKLVQLQDLCFLLPLETDMKVGSPLKSVALSTETAVV